MYYVIIERGGGSLKDFRHDYGGGGEGLALC